MLLNLIHSINLSHHYLLLLLPQFSLNLSPQNLKRAQQSWSAKSQQAAAQTGAALVSIVPSSSNGNLPSMDPWLAPRAVPGSSHGPEIATRCSPVTDRVNETRQYTRYRQRMMGAWDSNRGCHLLWGPRLRETIWRFLLGPRTPVAARAAGRRWIAMLTSIATQRGSLVKTLRFTVSATPVGHKSIHSNVTSQFQTVSDQYR